MSGQVAQDPVGGQTQERSWAHANTFDIAAATKSAFSQIGKACRVVAGAVGFDSTRRSLETLVNVAAVICLLVGKGMLKVFHGLTENDRRDIHAVCIGRHFDSTPMLLRYGSYQNDLFKVARYLRRVDPPENEPFRPPRWLLIQYDEWKKDHPHARRPESGVLEVLAQQCYLSWGGFRGSDADPDLLWRCSQECVAPPMLIDHSNASTTFSAVERAWSPFDLAGIHTLAASLSSEDGVVILGDVPDSAKPNVRLKNHVAQELAACPNALYNKSGRCEGHKLHTIITTEMKEDKVVGHAHAFQRCLTVQTRKKSLEQAALEIIVDEIDVQAGMPPEENVVHLENIIAHTFGRTKRFIVADTLDDEDAATFRAIEEALPALRAYANGDTRKPRTQHYCNGCCLDENGVVSKAIAAANFHAALVATGIFGGVCTRMPAASRWLTTSFVLAFIVAGTLLFSILDRAWMRAFPDWKMPHNEPHDDFHYIIRSKIYRVKLWFLDASTTCKNFMYCLISEPAEHLLQALQSLDARGRVLRDVCFPQSNPIITCRVAYAKMVLNPLQTIMLPLVMHFEAILDRFDRARLVDPPVPGSLTPPRPGTCQHRSPLSSAPGLAPDNSKTI